MSENPKKPRRDLRARLGKKKKKEDGDKAVTPPVGADVAAPIAAPSVPAPFGGNTAPTASPSADPFGSAEAPVATKEVRLVFDDTPVDDAEIGRKKKGRNLIILSLGALLGLALGFGGGSMLDRRGLYNKTVRDGHSIYRQVDAASSTVEQAQRHLQTIVEAARGSAEAGPAVDYETIEALVALERPLDAAHFTTKNYGAFRPETVEDLFQYFNRIQMIWERLRTLRAHTGANRRDELNRTATEAGEGTSLFGVIPLVVDQRAIGRLVFIEPGEEGSNNVNARITRGSRPVSLPVYNGEQTPTEAPSFVMLVDGAQSRGVLGDQTGAFGLLVREIVALKTLLDQTMEIQGRLTTALGAIAALQEVWVPFDTRSGDSH